MIFQQQTLMEITVMNTIITQAGVVYMILQLSIHKDSVACVEEHLIPQYVKMICHQMTFMEIHVMNM